MIGEVIESRTEQFVAESLKYNIIPPYGSFVKVIDNDRKIYGIVSGAYTGSLDGLGKARAFFKDMTELENEQPQVFSLLRSEFVTVVIGFSEYGKYKLYYPPAHVRLHLPVQTCEKDEIIGITSGTSFLNKTLNCPEANGEELTAAALRTAAMLREDSKEYLLNAGRELLKMLSYDTQRLKSVFERIDTF